MKDDCLVSVIIPTHYRNEQLRGAIQSVLAQEYEPVEVLVVDDSGEGYARQAVTDFEPVTYISLEQNRGAQAARAAGVDSANGEYIQFLDDDDRLLPGKLRQQVPLLSAEDDVGVVYCGLEWAGGPIVLPRPTVKGDVLPHALRFDTSPCMMGTMLIDRRTLAHVDLLKHDHAADDIGLKIELAQVTNFDFVDDVLVRRGRSENSVGTSMAAVEGRFEILEMYDDLYADFPAEIKREALAETYLVQGQLILADSFWSLAAIQAFTRATYHAPGLPLPYLGSLLSSLLGRPGYNLSRMMYSRFVLGSERRGKHM